MPLFNSLNNSPGKGDLVGCDISRFTSNGESAVVKSSSDVRALTYCDLEVAALNLASR